MSPRAWRQKNQWKKKKKKKRNRKERKGTEKKLERGGGGMLGKRQIVDDVTYRGAKLGKSVSIAYVSHFILLSYTKKGERKKYGRATRFVDSSCSKPTRRVKVQKKRTLRKLNRLYRRDESSGSSIFESEDSLCGSLEKETEKE